MAIDFRLTSLTSSGGERLNFPRSGVTCIVGGNNVGKSRLLREIDAALQSETATAATFSDLIVQKTTVDEAAAQAFLESVGVKTAPRDGYPQEWTSIAGGGQLSARQLVLEVNSHPIALNQGKPFFAWYASAGSLIGAASGSVGMPGMGSGGHPLMRLFRDGEREAELSALAESSFGVPLTLDRVNGNVRLRVGHPAGEVPPLNRPTQAYADAVGALPELEQQGDGIKSFLGLALTVLAGTYQVLLIDEPEAFLHPAQARSLGRWLGREALARDIQVVLSTHDRDLLLGLIDSDDGSVVNVVRITRDATTNHLRHLSAAEVSESWQDPVLRYSNLLQGLFHARAVITESDADCRFYRAVLDQLGHEEGRKAVADDLLFIPSGGKQRVAAMATALTQLGVETYAVVDFDALRSRDLLRGIVTALGADWHEAMNAAYVSVADVANQQALWGQLKNQGLSALPAAGGIHVAGRQLLDLLRTSRVLVVPVGEMEDLDKTVELHGGAWVSEMLSRGNHRTCAVARDLLSPLIR